MIIDKSVNNSPYVGSGQITREQFLFYEMRTTANLFFSGLSDKEIIDKIIKENLFQYPTEKSVRQMARICVNRLKCLESDDLVYAIAFSDSVSAKQICLFAMMKMYRIVWDFMITVIGEKYKQQDYSFSRRDVRAFFLRLQEQDEYVASWSDSTIKKMESVLSRLLIENEYIDDGKSTSLNMVLITSILENTIRYTGDLKALSAFNCLE